MIRLLIVDDEPTIRAGIRDSIPWEEYDITVVAEAGNGEDALEAVRSVKPDIALVDIVMPKSNGLDFCEAVRREALDLRILILSGHNDFAYAQGAIRAGVDDYLLKPVGADQLIAAVRKIAASIQGSRQSDLPHALLDRLASGGGHKPTSIERAVMTYIDAAYLSLPTLGGAAAAAGCSIGHLCRVLKAGLGLSFIELVNLFRVETAKLLLADSRLKLYEVADRAGFSDYAYFARIFKRIEGVSPGEYRDRGQDHA